LLKLLLFFREVFCVRHMTKFCASCANVCLKEDEVILAQPMPLVMQDDMAPLIMQAQTVNQANIVEHNALVVPSRAEIVIPAPVIQPLTEDEDAEELPPFPDVDLSEDIDDAPLPPPPDDCLPLSPDENFPPPPADLDTWSVDLVLDHVCGAGGAAVVHPGDDWEKLLQEDARARQLEKENRDRERRKEEQEEAEQVERARQNRYNDARAACVLPGEDFERVSQEDTQARQVAAVDKYIAEKEQRGDREKQQKEQEDREAEEAVFALRLERSRQERFEEQMRLEEEKQQQVLKQWKEQEEFEAKQADKAERERQKELLAREMQQRCRGKDIQEARDREKAALLKRRYVRDDLEQAHLRRVAWEEEQKRKHQQNELMWKRLEEEDKKRVREEKELRVL